ncbi:DUF3368 domain-containing protein [Methylomicrobium lacus]|uniref:DUF3368 domain-containing protein n=1 Tax=Methylomicrobium lacus TaxID=136992 RepID=UPI001FE09500|nr:DUF3368 domain-containing protein [Methylomicrobium lacus]
MNNGLNKSSLHMAHKVVIDSSPLIGLALVGGLAWLPTLFGQVLLIMDERAGRAVAKEKGLRVIGTAAIIGLAKKQGLIPSARAVFEVLHRSDFRISAAVINQVLISVNE